MYSALQPNRPKIPPSHSSSPPLNQQPTQPFTDVPTLRSIPSQPHYQAPRNQIEAMPPPLAPPQPAMALHETQQQFLSSMRHPVFFTDRFQKAPAGVLAGGGTWATPVAAGYIYNDGIKRPVDGSARL